MKKLPEWIMTKGQPAFYDTESATAIEMVSKLHGAVNTLIEEYNKAVIEFDTFEGTIEEKNECFKANIIAMMNDFIDAANMTHDLQSKEIEAAIEYMTTNINELAIDIVNKGLQDGSIVVNMMYDAAAEELAIVGSIVDDGSLSEVAYNPDEEQLIHND